MIPPLVVTGLLLSQLQITTCAPSVSVRWENENRLKEHAVAFYDPRDGGGSMLASIGNGFGEPLNMIISGMSSPEVLTDSGFHNYARSLGFEGNCLGLHFGNAFRADLGDGNGWAKQAVVLRYNFGLSRIGSCMETLIGGNHFRMFRQDGPNANSGALFLSVSYEESSLKNHKISPDGFNTGRDDLICLATRRLSKANGVTYLTTSEEIHGLLVSGNKGIGHGVQYPSSEYSQKPDLHFHPCTGTEPSASLVIQCRNRHRWKGQAPDGHYCITYNRKIPWAELSSIDASVTTFDDEL